MGAEDVADCLCVCADAVDAGDEVAGVSLEENGIFRPVVVFVVCGPGAFEEGVGFCFWVEDEAVGVLVQTGIFGGHWACLPAAHDVTVAAEDFG